MTLSSTRSSHLLSGREHHVDKRCRHHRMPQPSERQLEKEPLQMAESDATLIIPKPKLIRDSDSLSLEENDLSLPVPCRKKSAKHHHHGNHRYAPPRSSSHFTKLKFRADEDANGAKNGGKSCCQSPGHQDQRSATPGGDNHGEMIVHRSRLPRPSLCSSTGASWHSRFPSLLSFHSSSRAADEAEVIPLSVRQRAKRRRRNDSKRLWYERPDSEKGKVVPDKPLYPMHMVFFDGGDTSDDPLSDDCLGSESSNLPESRDDTPLSGTTTNRSNDNLDSLHDNNSMNIERDESKVPSNRGEDMQLGNERLRDLSPATTPETLDSQGNGLEHNGKGLKNDITEIDAPVGLLKRIWGFAIRILGAIASVVGYEAAVVAAPLCGKTVSGLWQQSWGNS